MYVLCPLPVGIVPPRTKSPTDNKSPGVFWRNGRGMSRVCQTKFEDHDILILSVLTTHLQSSLFNY